LEDLTDEELEKLQAEFRRLHEKNTEPIGGVQELKESEEMQDEV
jgi:hypothetical protein